MAAGILLPLVAIPQFLSKQERFEVLRRHVGEIAEITASAVDGDLHRRLLDPENFSEELYAETLAPLVRLHSADSKIHYLYTMVEKDGEAYFVVDTASSPDLRTSRELKASEYFEKFEPNGSEGWLSVLASGKTYITPDFEQDDYGTFISGHAPIYDSQGRYSGFVGVDIDMDTYIAGESRFRAIAVGTLGAALLLALLVGYGASLYVTSMRNRVRELYQSSITDNLTGFLNRRGAMEIIKPTVNKQGGWAVLVVDVDGLKVINTLRGNATGDAVLARISEAIRSHIREGDYCARMGNEFMICCPGCTPDAANSIGKRIVEAVAGKGLRLVGANFSISVGITVHEGAGEVDFTQLYREADQALAQAKLEGQNQVSTYQTAA